LKSSNVVFYFAFKLVLIRWSLMSFFFRLNGDQAHWIYAWIFDALHAFDIICNADNVQTWPTSIMWQGKSTNRFSLSKGRRFDSNESAIDLIIGPWFEIMTSMDANLRIGRWLETGCRSESIIYIYIYIYICINKVS
jgi:hypothetical protein